MRDSINCVWMSSFFLFWAFLDASTHLYTGLCPSVGPSVCWSVGPSVTTFFKTLNLAKRSCVIILILPHTLFSPSISSLGGGGDGRGGEGEEEVEEEEVDEVDASLFVPNLLFPVQLHGGATPQLLWSFLFNLVPILGKKTAKARTLCTGPREGGTTT